MLRVILTAFLAAGFLAGSLFAPEGAKADDTDILQIQSVPDIDMPTSTKETEDALDGGGTIQRIGRDETGRPLIVIDDRLRYLAKTVSYFTKDGLLADRMHFHAGITVGYRVNENKEITELYLN